MAPEQKANTAQKGGEVLDFDPRRLREDQRIRQRTPVTITQEDGEEVTVLVPTEGNESEDGLIERALEFAAQMKEGEATFGKRLLPETEDTLLQTVALATALVVVNNLLGVGHELFGEEEFDKALSGDDDLETVTEKISGDRFNRFAGEFLARLRSSSGKALALLTHQTALAGVMAAFREKHDVDALSDEEYDRLLTKAMREEYDSHLWTAIEINGQQLAEAYLNDLKPSRMTLEELVLLLVGEPGAEEAPPGSIFRTDIGQEVRLPTDRALERIAKWIGGRQAPVDSRDGYDVLKEVRTRSVQAQIHIRESRDYLAEVITPENVEPVLARIQAERNETKAKVLVASFALASAPTVRNASEVMIDLHDFVTLVSGYQRSGAKKTTSRVYWRKVAEILRYLHVDLAGLQVNIRVTRGKEKRDGVVGHYLMRRPRLVSDQPLVYDELYDRLSTLIIQGGGKSGSEEERHAVEFLQHSRVTDVILGFDEPVMRSFGYHQNALEITNSEVLKLSGPTFWLAYDIAFRRRWSDPKRLKPGAGLLLLELLEEHGYLEESMRRTGGRPSYTHALKAFFASVRVLLDLGELEDPGVRIWGSKAGRPYDMRKTIESWVKARGKRITEQDLAELRVQYTFREERLRELEKARSAARKKSAGRTPKGEAAG